jgi:integrase
VIDPALQRGRLEFLILTAARLSEVTKAKWSEIDFDNRIWTIPASRMKAGNEHRVPLSDRAIAILQALPRQPDNDHVFIGAVERRGLSGLALGKVLVRLDRADLTTHGFRSTFRTWAAERTSYAREVAEQALAHTIGTAVERAYARTSLFDHRRRLMRDWASYCCSRPVEGTVTPLRGRS